MKALYNIATKIIAGTLPLAGNFNHKLKLFTRGRKSVFNTLKEKIQPEAQYLWFHTASLGEFEQALPIIEEIKKDFPIYKILITFFSPSGYENKKKHLLADIITYLPLDTTANAKRFLELVNPKMAFFIKYEIWPNYLAELKKRSIKTLLISGAFRKDQIYFKPYGSFMRNALSSFDHFFVQNQESVQMLEKIGFSNVSLSGDTRFDRVSRQIEQDNKLVAIEEFLQQKPCFVMGSTWPEDEELFLKFINSTAVDIKFIIAPHEIKESNLNKLQDKIQKNTIRYSELENYNPEDFKVLIIDNIGLLGRIYSYASIAYVGGAAGKTGLHNILEPATFGIPIIIGENHSKFPEAIRLKQLAGLFSVSTAAEFTAISNKLLQEDDFREKTGMIAGHFINSNAGATKIIMSYLHKNRL